MINIATRLTILLPLIVISLGTTTWASSTANFQPAKNSTAVTRDIVRKLSRQHYATIELNDALSERLLQRYLDYIDPAKLYLTEADIKEFTQFEQLLDDQLKAGSVAAGYTIYNRLHQRTVDRLHWINSQLPALIESFDFTIDESILLDYENQPWAEDMAALDERWRLRIKNDVLSMRINDEQDILATLRKRYDFQLKRIQQIKDHDVYSYYIDTYAKLYDPHTNYFSPQQMENFRINMSRSLEGIGAVLTQDYEYTKIVSLVSKGPADRQGGLKASDRIVGVGQGKEGELTNVIGWDYKYCPQRRVLRLSL